MNTSDIVSIGSRPLLPSSEATYSQQPKDALYTRLLASLAEKAWVRPTNYEPYLYEFPGDRTTERYIRNRTGA